MLILTRRVGETVMIGNDVTVTVLGVKGNQVRVGINAPKDVPVHREEIYERIQRELQQAMRSERLVQQVIDAKLAEWQQLLARQEQKLQDGLAAQTWWRGQQP